MARRATSCWRKGRAVFWFFPRRAGLQERGLFARVLFLEFGVAGPDLLGAFLQFLRFGEPVQAVQGLGEFFVTSGGLGMVHAQVPGADGAGFVIERNALGVAAFEGIQARKLDQRIGHRGMVAAPRLDMNLAGAFEERFSADGVALQAVIAREAVERGASLDDVLALPVRAKIGRMKYVDEARLSEIGALADEVRRSVGAIAAGGGEDVA